MVKMIIAVSEEVFAPVAINTALNVGFLATAIRNQSVLSMCLKNFYVADGHSRNG